MDVMIKVDRGKINALTAAARKALGMTAEQLRTELIQAQVVPFDEGTLQNVQTYIDVKALDEGRVSIVHDTPYAARVYFHPEFNFKTDTNANARAYWWEDWLIGDKQHRPAQLFKKFYKSITGVD